MNPDLNFPNHIYQRKSTRKYEMTPLSEETLHKIRLFPQQAKRLFPNITLAWEILPSSAVKSLLPISAPYYLVISSDTQLGYLINAGFVFQQLDLYLSALELGSCWLGMAKTTKKWNSELEFVIILAFGKALASPYRDISEFKRKPLNEIADYPLSQLEAARLAPSATNSQPWYFKITSQPKGETDSNFNVIMDVYCIKSNPVRALLYQKMNQIDMGISLSHLYLENQSTFSFEIASTPPEKRGFQYIGSIKI